MIYYKFRSYTIIEELMQQKCKNKSDFKKEIFIKMKKKRNKKNMIAENNVETDFVKKVSIVMSKII